MLLQYSNTLVSKLHYIKLNYITVYTVNNSLAKLQTSARTLTISNIYTSKGVEE